MICPRLALPLLAATIAFAAGDANAATVDANPAAVGRALDIVRNHGAAVRASVDDRFVQRDVIVDADGTEHVRLARTYGGLPVIGGDVVVHSRFGRLQSASVTQAAALRLGTRPTLQAAEAVAIAGAEFGAGFTGLPTRTLVVYARGKGAPRLAWQIQFASDDADMTYFVDANNGRLLDRWSNRHTAIAAGAARSLYAGTVGITTNSIAGGYELRDPARGNGVVIDASNTRTSGQVYTDTDNVWGNFTVSDAATAAADAHYGARVTWDFYRTALGRLGIANNGKGATSRVHYGRRYNNAYWNNGCFCMTYGDGDGVNLGPLVALDIAGHEMSHGVNSHTADLYYSGESGGLNEANSDILGTMVEFHANNAHDTPDYLIGEEVYLANVSGSADQRALRYMYNPIADTRSPNCYVPTLGELDVHFSSGVANRFFYLLAEGSGARTYSGVNHAAPTCNGAAVAGIGRTKAAKVWYRALSVYLTSDSDYAAARAATIHAAADLYGATSVEAGAVAAAWSAVNVN